MTVVVEGLDDLSLENYRRVAFGGEGVSIGDAARATMLRRRAEFLRLLDSDRTQFIYGVTSNFGPRARQVVPPERQREHARGFPTGRGSVARSFGSESLPERVVRGIVFARLANFVSGGAKVRPLLAERVADLLGHALPPLPLEGECGAGEVLPMFHVMRGVERGDLEEGEGNACSNGSPVSAALAADTAVTSAARLDHAVAILTLSLEVLGAPLPPETALAEDLWVDPAERWAADAVRSLRPAGIEPPAAGVARSLLATTHVLAGARRATEAVESAARISLRSVTDNPVFIPPDHRSPLGRAVSTGGFHNAMAYPAFNRLAATWADLATLAGRHARLLAAASPAAAVPGADGLVVAARTAALPTLLPAAVNDPQDDIASPGLAAYRRAERAAACLDGVLAVVAAEATRQAGAPRSGPLAEVARWVATHHGEDPGAAPLAAALGWAAVTGDRLTLAHPAA